MTTALGRTLVAVVVLSVTAPAMGNDAAQTAVRLVDTTPVTLRGVRFVPHESVRLEVRLDERIAVRKVSTGSGGGFHEVFPALYYDRCHGPLVVRAVGSRGSRVSWNVVPLEGPTRVGSA